MPERCKRGRGANSLESQKSVMKQMAFELNLDVSSYFSGRKTVRNFQEKGTVGANMKNESRQLCLCETGN